MYLPKPRYTALANNTFLVAQVVLAILIPVPIFLKHKKMNSRLKRKSSAAPTPWDIYDSYLDGPLRSPRRRPARGKRDLSPDSFHSGFEEML